MSIDKEIQLNSYLFQMIGVKEADDLDLRGEKVIYILTRAQTACYNLLILKRIWKRAALICLCVTALFAYTIFRILTANVKNGIQAVTAISAALIIVAVFLLAYAIHNIFWINLEKEEIYSMTVKFQMHMERVRTQEEESKREKQGNNRPSNQENNEEDNIENNEKDYENILEDYMEQLENFIMESKRFKKRGRQRAK